MYQLICMSFDGEYVKDHKGTLEECRNASDDMGSKWYFYPWHLIITEKYYIKEMYGCFCNIKDSEPILNKMFSGRKLETIQKIFSKASNNQLELENADVHTFENYIINNNQNLLRR